MVESKYSENVVELKDGNSVYLYDSDRDISIEDVREWHEGNEDIEENSSEYWDEIDNMRGADWDDFISNLTNSKAVPKKAVIIGAVGTWHGNCNIVPVVAEFYGNEKPFLQKFAISGDFEMAVGYDDDGLFVRVAHHDGTNFFHIREVTTAGENYLTRCKCTGETPESICSALYSRKIDWWLF